MQESDPTLVLTEEEKRVLLKLIRVYLKKGEALLEKSLSDSDNSSDSDSDSDSELLFEFEPEPEPKPEKDKKDFKIFVIKSNKINKAYIGTTTQKSLKARFSQIKGAYNRYNADNTKSVRQSYFSILDEPDCEMKLLVDMLGTRDEANKAKDDYIRSFIKSGYKVLNGGVYASEYRNRTTSEVDPNVSERYVKFETDPNVSER